LRTAVAISLSLRIDFVIWQISKDLVLFNTHGTPYAAILRRHRLPCSAEISLVGTRIREQRENLRWSGDSGRNRQVSTPRIP
jgi:hypothetical protein